MSVFALVERLGLLIESEVNLVINCKQEAESVSSKLNKIQVGLQEAERKGVTDKTVKKWLKELEDVAYEMDDVLDEWATSNLQVEVQDTSLNWDKVRTLLNSLCLCFKQVLSRREITQKMKALSNRIDTILASKGEYTFVQSESDISGHESKQEESISLVLLHYGLEGDKNRLVQKLIFEGGGEDTQVISIVGVGGLGKTTLAGVAYNDPQVEGLFSPKGWVSVSQSSNASAIARAILVAFGEKVDGDTNLDSLVQSIIKVVNQKRFLLVLDNVWEEGSNKWEQIKKCLRGGKGSRIVVTTRDDAVARIMGTDERLSLGLLSHTDCGKILNGVALEGRSREEYEKLRDIGTEIAKKCNGLPLAAKSVGSMLKLGSFTVEEWSDVLESPLWTDGEEETEVFRILNLSYTDLSPVLKRCFLSSVFFPKGAEIRSDEIIRLWMAYGYLNSNTSIDKVQSKGFQYLNKLEMRSFFQRVERDKDRTSYKIHDIMHDFASYLSESDGYSFIMDDGLEELESSSFDNKWRRLRTFRVPRVELDPGIFSYLTSVKVLNVSDCNLYGLPDEVGNLIHLRYLDVSHNLMDELPETITDLCNLQTLDIEHCQDLSCLPEGIGKMINLRHLLNADTSSLMEFPQGIENLSGLWTLEEYRGGNLGRLRNMDQLQGSLFLRLWDLNEREAGNAGLSKKQHLKKLSLAFDRNENLDGLVEALEPPPYLETLDLDSFWGLWLSHWIPTSFGNLKTLKNFGSQNSSYLPFFHKLPHLEDLEMIQCSGVGNLNIKFHGLEDASLSGQVVGGFPRLKRLRFSHCYSLQEWEDIAQESTFPVMKLLEELDILGCVYLKSLPLNLLSKATSLRVVKISDCRGLHKRYNNVSGCDRDKIPLLPNQAWIVDS